MKRQPIFNKSSIGDFQLSLHAANANSQKTVFTVYDQHAAIFFSMVDWHQLSNRNAFLDPNYQNSHEI